MTQDVLAVYRRTNSLRLTAMEVGLSHETVRQIVNQPRCQECGKPLTDWNEFHPLAACEDFISHSAPKTP